MKRSLTACCRSGGSGSSLSRWRETVRCGPSLESFLSERGRPSGAAANLGDGREGTSTSPHLFLKSDGDPLVDSHGRFHNYLRISLSERCNLRCTYCMPEKGVKLSPSHELLTTEELLRLVHLFASSGVDKVRLTGGDPLLRKDLARIVGGCRDAGIQQVGITTNGIVLKRHLRELKAAGLTSINLSLDTLVRERFLHIARRDALATVLQSLEAAVEMGFLAAKSIEKGGRSLKVNCVIMRGVNDDEFGSFLELARKFPIDLRFIEWMPFDQNRWNEDSFMNYREMLQRVEELSEVEQMKLVRLPTSDPRGAGVNDTTKWYEMISKEGTKVVRGVHSGNILGRVGFITSMSDHFCGGCNRLRITADGKLKLCLFGDESLSLRDAMRLGLSNRDIFELIGASVRKKKPVLGGYNSMHAIAAGKNRPMTLIGG